MKKIADMTKGHESVRFVWYDPGDIDASVSIFEGNGPRTLDDKAKRTTREDARKLWRELEAKGFVPVILTGRDELGARIGTLSDGTVVTEFPGGGWAVPEKGDPSLYRIVNL